MFFQIIQKNFRVLNRCYLTVWSDRLCGITRNLSDGIQNLQPEHKRAVGETKITEPLSSADYSPCENGFYLVFASFNLSPIPNMIDIREKVA